MFELYATGGYTLRALSQAVFLDTGKRPTKSWLGRILKSRFYRSHFRWAGCDYKGSHLPLVDSITFETVQNIISGEMGVNGLHRAPRADDSSKGEM
jgi:hypothetical protein